MHKKYEHQETPRHIIIKSFKTTDKKKILKAAQGKNDALHRVTKIRMAIDFL